MQNQSLKFYHLKYDVSEIKYLIDTYQDINNFVFSYYSSDPEKPIGLIAYVRKGLDCTAYTYADESNILVPEEKVLDVHGVTIMSNNFIPIEEMKSLIHYSEKDDHTHGYLLFTPVVNDSKHVYYSIEPFLNDGEVVRQGPVSTTNPSPPATMTI